MTYVINQGWVMYWGTARWSPAEVNTILFYNKASIVQIYVLHCEDYNLNFHISSYKRRIC